MGNRFVLGEHAYTTKALGGGRFDVLNRASARVGGFAIQAGVVQVDDEGLDESRPVVKIAEKWVAENLSSPLPVRDPNAPPVPSHPTAQPEPTEPSIAPLAPAPAPSSPGEAGEAAAAQAICRMGLHRPPDVQALARARRHMEWLRTQKGVLSGHLTQDPSTGKVLSIVVYASREVFASMRYATPPSDAAPLDPVKMEQTLIVG